jgi:cytochrome c-type biogenesis protein CcmH
MSGATAFFIAAAVLLAVVLLILVRPLLRRRSATTGGINQRDANLAILRGELRELERSRDEGSLSADDFAQARQELQRRLLEEAGIESEVAAPATQAAGKRTVLILLFALPLAAAGGYALLGMPQALDPAATQARVSPQEIDGMLQKLVDRLKTNRTIRRAG